jgi:L,D-transpeptidase catalytic domain
MRRHGLLLAGALLLATPASASAATALGVTGAHRVGKERVAFTGTKLTVRGSVVPFAEGTTVVVTVRRNRKSVRTLEKPVVAGEGGRGTFETNLRIARAGSYMVVARSGDSRAHLALRGVRAGSRGPLMTRFVQGRLGALGYAVPRSGRMDDGTRRALMAFRKVNAMRRGFGLNAAIVRRLAEGKGGFGVRYPSHGKHVEANLSRQVLALINPDGKVYKVFHTSSGKSSTPTVRGSYRFYLKTPGTNAKGMVHSNYFIRGYAIHGYKEVPAYPASHGCLRVPIPNAMFIYRWVRIGDRIDVYG